MLWRIFSVACVVIGLIPIYGYFAHVARDEQITVLFLFLAWVITSFNIGVSLARLIILWRTRQTAFWGILSIVLAILAYFGFFAIGNAIRELWA